MKEWKLRVDEITPSANVWDRTHFRKKSRMIKAWFWLLYEQIYSLKYNGNGITRAKKKRAIRVSRFSHSTKPLDELNIHTPVDKLIIDNLRKLGVLMDDSPRWFKSLGNIARRTKGENKTVITVREP